MLNCNDCRFIFNIINIYMFRNPHWLCRLSSECAHILEMLSAHVFRSYRCTKSRKVLLNASNKMAQSVALETNSMRAGDERKAFIFSSY